MYPPSVTRPVIILLVCYFFVRLSCISEYGAVFRLSTVISNYTTLSDFLTGDNILGCFGFDPDRYEADLLCLIVIGCVGLLLAYALLKIA